jgi:hypothetical protein
MNAGSSTRLNELFRDKTTQTRGTPSLNFSNLTALEPAFIDSRRWEKPEAAVGFDP